MESITIRRPDDFHVHLRQGELLETVVTHTAADFARAIVMPNTVPPIISADDVVRYRGEIAGAVERGFEPLMTIKITPGSRADMVHAAAGAGVIAGKLYPQGVTTNSSDGVRDFDRLLPAFAAMADLGMVLCVHGEDSDAFCLDREEVFLTRTLPWILAAVPRLRVVVEHISTAAAVEWIRAQPASEARVAASVTVHHLLLTLDDVVGDLLEPHHFCKPLAKRPADRQSLIEAVTSGDGRFFLGTDSAPHPMTAKERAGGCAGVFTAPVALAILAGVFANASRLDQLERFTSVNGATFYGLPLNDERVRIVRRRWKVPGDYSGIVPLLAGKTLDWQLDRDL